MAEVEGASPTRARAAEISSGVRFLDFRKAMRFSTGEAATDGSWRTVRDGLEGEVDKVI